ncbi:xanthine dehydrogenase family protein molybdopterin-binding subunit [Haliangium ochraceum]|uniref:Aldehyde oxidase and xanthine dehydrogenase molybdopterin binding protein n=1 Tax=Haliangium ochraceum (strain DSM 14365 / JCM 11303 / SMP-2) TaxID=502025 RepID=D0LNJ1_HALO1|nr:xanthine dehydrogenase family protein molybdopterin-binding subunit [Haliangium ochraceum]ACY16896.1 aldehyde oxidase and xanthine dehydrogenase molybdopterin binding protein [Haliangium ochraceum DSM 14365]
MNSESRSVIGRPVPRVDGPRKVSGRAPYAAEHELDTRPYHAWIVEAARARATIARIDSERAAAAPGVIRVITHDNAPPQRPYGEPEDAGRFAMSHALLCDRQVRYRGQAVALVVAETLEAARAAAQLVEVEYSDGDASKGGDGDSEGVRHAIDGSEPESAREKPDELDGGLEPDVCPGDFDRAYADADVTVDSVYTTAGLISAAMEPHATIAQWRDDGDGKQLTVYSSNQILQSAVTALATTFCLEESQVRVLAPYIGGGFGSKLAIHADAVLASIAAMVLDHPVKLVQTRRNLFTNGPHRGNSHQRLRLGAKRDGTITAVGQDSVMPMAIGYAFAEPVASSARASYRCDAMHTTHRVIPVAMPPIDSMRAPGEAIGTLALEAALDELALELDMDPLALRLQNIPEREPQSGKPFASNDLRRCLERGAERFGWSQRPPPRQRQGRFWKGWGMAACTRFNILMEAEARVRLTRDGHAVAELDMTDLGTGSYTILSQIVADTLGLALDAVTVHLGDSSLPATAGSGGSFGAASAGGALLNACRALREQLAELARTHQGSALRGRSGEACLSEGRLHLGDASSALAELVALAGEELSAEGSVAPGDDQEKYAQYSYGAHFVELSVDGASGEVRLERALGAFSFGRVLNPITARSQLIGGMTFGIGGALTEALMLDPRYGIHVNRDFAEYHLAVQRDVPPLEVLMLGEPDPKCGPLQSKGVGELGLCGIGGAIANAVFHATGVRVRDFPITPDKVLAGLPPL